MGKTKASPERSSVVVAKETAQALSCKKHGHCQFVLLDGWAVDEGETVSLEAECAECTRERYKEEAAQGRAEVKENEAALKALIAAMKA